jgi:hypothetical protein
MGLFRILTLMSIMTVAAVALVHEDVHQRAKQNDQIGKIWQDVSAVFYEKKIERSAQKD